MNNYKKLVSNSLVFAIGNLGTKLIIFFLVPLYTYYLTTSEFGLVDLLTTTINLLLPILTMSISQSVLRFAMDMNYDRHSVLINSLVVVFTGFIVLLLCYPIFKILLPLDGFIIHIYLLLLMQSIYNVLAEYIRAQGKVKLFAISGIINACVLLVSNIIFLVVINMGIVGYLVSIIIANIFSSIFVIIGGRIFLDIRVKKINMKLMKEMLKYSIPLIPNAILWWIMGLSDRYIITYYLGLSANGVYAVASKIPSILNIIHSIFFQAWQMSAIEEADSKDKSNFFTNVFSVFSVTMLVSTSLIIVHLKIIIDIFIGGDYSDVWKYIPFLLLGAVFSSFSGFLGTNYIASKKTTGVIKTSVTGAILNIVINILLIPLIGIYGAAIGTMISFAIVWIYRIKDTNRFVHIKLNVKNLLFTLIIVFFQIGVLYINFDFEYLLQLGLFTIILIINLREIKLIKFKLIDFMTNKLRKSR